jgi:hypothetical protein
VHPGYKKAKCELADTKHSSRSVLAKVPRHPWVRLCNGYFEHKRNLANNTGAGGGGAKLTMGIRNVILQRSQIWKRGKLI